MKETFFAPPGRRDKQQVAQEMATVTHNPVIDAVMKSVGGLLAVLNEQRQILAVNDTLLQMLGISDIGQVMGLRPGEAIGCVHSADPPDGCGTTRYCSTCGAAVAILTSLNRDTPEERDCAVTVMRDGETLDLSFRVRAHPILVDARRYLLLFLQDTTSVQKRAALERVFFHDINNIISGLQGLSDLIDCKDPTESPRLVDALRQLVSRLTREVKIQQALSGKNSGMYATRFQGVVLADVFQELRLIIENHSATAGQRVVLPTKGPWPDLHTDRSLLVRILTNMLINALEAGGPGETVHLNAEMHAGNLRFNVWNRQPIPQPIALRIFQRNFTTKNEAGRGLGTYSMKLFGEQALSGKVDFETGPAGTTFWLELPI
ncbi:MAG: HAMP domain-containing sensor histidine kinase [Pseudomonadota bacterium]